MNGPAASGADGGSVAAHEGGATRDLLELVGRRWTAAVLSAAVGGGARRFGEFRRSAVGISDRLLSVRLKDLERHGLLRREVIPGTPAQILYHPTSPGIELVDALQPLLAWGSRHMPAAADPESRP